MFKKILVPVDGSKHSMLAKRKAMGIASSMEAEIVLMYATDHIPNLIGGDAREEVAEGMVKEADGILEKYRAILEEKGVNYTERVVSGRAGDMICHVAKEEECDLIVMGCRGLSDLEGMVLGSVTHRVLSTCNLPVLVAR